MFAHEVTLLVKIIRAKAPKKQIVKKNMLRDMWIYLKYVFFEATAFLEKISGPRDRGLPTFLNCAMRWLQCGMSLIFLLINVVMPSFIKASLCT